MFVKTYLNIFYHALLLGGFWNCNDSILREWRILTRRVWLLFCSLSYCSGCKMNLFFSCITWILQRMQIWAGVRPYLWASSIIVGLLRAWPLAKGQKPWNAIPSRWQYSISLVGCWKGWYSTWWKILYHFESQWFQHQVVTQFSPTNKTRLSPFYRFVNSFWNPYLIDVWHHGTVFL